MKNPTITTSSKNLKPVFEGLDNIPIPSGKNMDVQEEGNVMPEVDMSTNDGGNPKIADSAASTFATGKDTRSQSNSRGSAPAPGKVGA
jgi:hypothetical protein